MKSTRGRNGQSLTELAVGLMVVVPIVLFLIDVGTIFLGASVNSQICRDAARAAAAGAPNAIAPGQPQQRAETVIRKTNNVGGALRMDPNCVVTESVRQPLPAPPFGGPVDGQVTVRTRITVYPPFIVGGVVGRQGVSLQDSQTFPYTYVMANNAGANGAPGGGNGPALPNGNLPSSGNPYTNPVTGGTPGDGLNGTR